MSHFFRASVHEQAQVGLADGQVLDGPEFAPAQGVDDVVLECRVQAAERTHRSSSMLSTLVAWASRSVAVISPVLSVNW